MAKKCPTLSSLLLHAELTQQPLSYALSNKLSGLPVERHRNRAIVDVANYQTGTYLMVFQANHRVMRIEMKPEYRAEFLKACTLRAIQYLRQLYGDVTTRFGDYLDALQQKTEGALSTVEFDSVTKVSRRVEDYIGNLRYACSSVASMCNYARQWSPDAAAEEKWQEQWWRDCMCAATEQKPVEVVTNGAEVAVEIITTLEPKTRKPRVENPPCPKCGQLCLHEADAKTFFGYRTMKRIKKDGIVVYTTARQSWCKKCKRAQPRKQR